MRRALGFGLMLLAIAACDSAGSEGPRDVVGSDTAGAGDTADVSGETPKERLVDLVDPRIGTGGHAFRAGNAFVGAMLPFGMVQAGPDTFSEAWPAPWDHCSGYNADDDLLLAFSHAHLHGTGIATLGPVGFRPVAGEMTEALSAAGRTTPLDKTSESARPGTYAVTLPDDGVHVALTASERGAIHRYERADGSAGPLTLVVDLAHTVVGGQNRAAGLHVDPGAGTAQAWALNQDDFTVGFGGVTVYHALRYPTPLAAWGSWAGGELAGEVADQEGVYTGFWLTWDLEAGEAVEIQVGLSYVDAAGAAGNLDVELAGKSFDELRAEADARWDDELSVVSIEGGTDEERVLLATSLYHAFLMPSLFADSDGRYRGLDGDVHQAEGFAYYTNFSLWDTYRTLHPLLVLLRPERQRDMLRSFVRMAEEGGYVPKWPLGTGYTNCMVGTAADVVAGGSVAKGITDFDAEALYESLVVTATTPTGEHAYAGREGVADYMALGYVPVETVSGSVARTLEFAIGDYGLANLAEALGHADEALAFAERAGNYRNLWYAESGHFFPRRADGGFEADTDPLEVHMGGGAYTEGSALQYRWLVPHDAPALITLFGSAEHFVAELESFFAEAIVAEAAHQEAVRTDPFWWMSKPAPYYWHGNEPDIHAAYLFAEAGRPDRTQYWVREIADTWYSTAIDGVPGNDDAGTLGAWYVFSALGFYPIAGGDRYWLGTPFFERATLHLAGGDLVIEAPGASPERRYVTEVRFGDTVVDGPTFSHAALVEAGSLHFQMSSEPLLP